MNEKTPFYDAKFKKYQLLSLCIYLVLVYLDIQHGKILRLAFGQMNKSILLILGFTIYFVQSYISLGVFVIIFTKFGSKNWENGGRSQFGHAGGFTLQFYLTLAIVAITLICFAFFSNFHNIYINNPYTVFISCSVLTLGLSIVVARNRFIQLLHKED